MPSILFAGVSGGGMKFKLADPYYALSDCGRFTIVPPASGGKHLAYKIGKPSQMICAGTREECKAACESEAAEIDPAMKVAA